MKPLEKSLGLYERAGQKIKPIINGYLEENSNSKLSHYLKNCMGGFLGRIKFEKENPEQQEQRTLEEIQKIRFSLAFAYSNLRCYLDLLENNPEFKREHIDPNEPVPRDEIYLYDIVKKHKNELTKRVPIYTSFVLNHLEIMDPYKDDRFDEEIYNRFVKTRS